MVEVMTDNIFQRNSFNHPVDVAQAIKWAADDSTNESVFKGEDADQILKELEDAIYWVKAAADNEYNPDYWRTLYTALSAIADLPEYQMIPF